MIDIEKRLIEAKALLKDGFIDVGLWRFLLLIEKHYLIGEQFKCRQAIANTSQDVNLRVLRGNRNGYTGL